MQHPFYSEKPQSHGRGKVGTAQERLSRKQAMFGRHVDVQGSTNAVDAGCAGTALVTFGLLQAKK
ncbi:MAG: hypothetical protein ACWA5X_03135 [bacterium]